MVRCQGNCPLFLELIRVSCNASEHLSLPSWRATESIGSSPTQSHRLSVFNSPLFVRRRWLASLSRNTTWDRVHSSSDRPQRSHYESSYFLTRINKKLRQVLEPKRKDHITRCSSVHQTRNCSASEEPSSKPRSRSYHRKCYCFQHSKSLEEVKLIKQENLEIQTRSTQRG